MEQTAVPMFHVPDVRATVDWYTKLGFDVVNTYANEGDGLSFAILSFGSSRVMFNQGGQPSSSRRREVDLYIYTDGIDDLYQQLKERVEIIEPPHDTFYGMRELICRDLNRFWITFGQSSAHDSFLTAVQNGSIDKVNSLLHTNKPKPETLTAALVLAIDQRNEELIAILKTSGATSPAIVDAGVLQSYAGTYTDGAGFEVNVSFRDGRLYGALGKQEPFRLFALNQTTFTPLEFEDYGRLVFCPANGKVNQCKIKHGEFEKVLNRIEG